MKIQDAINERSNNFTLMRLLAAFVVLYSHSYALSRGINGGEGGEDSISRFIIKHWGESLPSLAVDMFFVISGFLVTASYIQRGNLFAFIEARALRIFPGLIVAVLFCIFVVGAAVTTESLASYFSSSLTFSYFKHNVLLFNGIQFDLPGVFTTNPYLISVNGSLWTLPIELGMYFWITILGACTLLQSEKTFNLFFLVTLLIYLQSTNGGFFLVYEARNAQLAFLFMLGGFFYVNRKNIPLDFSCLLGLIVFAYLFKEHSFLPLIKFILFAYFVLLWALHPAIKIPSIDKWGDFSYGLYIYAFPVQQTVAYLFPSITPMSMFALATPITGVLAFLSWHLVEKPALRMKGKIKIGRPHIDVRAADE